MLTKVNNNNYHLGTTELYKYFKYNKKNCIAQDNLNGNIIIKHKNNIYIYNYYTNKYYKHNKIQIQFNDKLFIKHIDSFDQNNYMIANKLRNYILKLVDKNIDTILGIGGEYYMYFFFINAVKYIGISNHNTIINDSIYNIPWSINYLVDYNNINTFPNIKYANIIILNVFNIHNNIINYIKKIKFNKLILISCNLPNNKLKELCNTFKILHIKYFINISGIIRIILFSTK